jgi:hypothetical protein
MVSRYKKNQQVRVAVSYMSVTFCIYGGNPQS